MLSVASWDHLTSKGLMRAQPDVVTVWNETQRQEAVDLHGVPAERVVVTGAVPFDRWFDREPRRARAEFCAHVGLDCRRKFVLFVGSSASISTPAKELAFVREWLQRVRESDYPELRECGVLIRPHPYNNAHWGDMTVTGHGDVAIYPRHGASPARPDDRADFFDSLYHSAAVVGLNTSAMIEAAVVGRPVCTVLSPDFAATQNGTLHFRYLLPEHGGFVRAAATFDEHLGHLREALHGSDAGRDSAEAFVNTFVRPLGRQVAAAGIVADAAERLATQPPHQPEPAPLWTPVARAALWSLGFAGALRDPVSRHRLRRQFGADARDVKRKSLTEHDLRAARRIYSAARKRRKRVDVQA